VAGLGAAEQNDAADAHSARRLLCLELDQQLAGAAELVSGALADDLGVHPWSELPGRPELVRRKVPPCETLLVERLGWHAQRAPSEDADLWLRAALAGTCERLGASRVVAPILLNPPFAPASYLQQLHFRAVQPPPAIRRFFAADFTLRGFYRAAGRDDGAVAVMAWESPRS